MLPTLLRYLQYCAARLWDFIAAYAGSGFLVGVGFAHPIAADPSDLIQTPISVSYTHLTLPTKA